MKRVIGEWQAAAWHWLSCGGFTQERFLSLQLEWVAAKDLLNNLCRGRWKNGVIGQRGALWTDQSLLLLFFCTLYWDAKVYSSWKDHGWPAEEGCWRFTNSPFFLPSPSEIITWNRERKAVLTNGAVNKTLPLLSGWRAWNRVKNHSNVDFTEDKL